jgi:hypothetical protein
MVRESTEDIMGNRNQGPAIDHTDLGILVGYWTAGAKFDGRGVLGVTPPGVWGSGWEIEPMVLA